MKKILVGAAAFGCVRGPSWAGKRKSRLTGLDKRFEQWSELARPPEVSGCHCTPMQKRAAGRSIASMTPSGAVAETVKPSATYLTA